MLQMPVLASWYSLYCISLSTIHLVSMLFHYLQSVFFFSIRWTHFPSHVSYILYGSTFIFTSVHFHRQHFIWCMNNTYLPQRILVFITYFFFKTHLLLKNFQPNYFYGFRIFFTISHRLKFRKSNNPNLTAWY